MSDAKEVVNNLIDIRCPFKKTSKVDGLTYTCNRVCVRVFPGSSGEAKCKECHLFFEFEVDIQAKPVTGVRVKTKE